ncbi:hypothetical protein O0I10_011608 [Lichtheimia ornata]|uniref:NAD-dependent epimerase/dehydratase domain-containing protein n=1 Tax=Lichtheimia ornata TaxID=688661 RepID=A0AAD7UTB9_9FUNG|nr:uncharacterized protein O0I10_011608 [Lichtheimia ornata]KAJ8652726.1 hypothetical protein O0I10_011608 [Lichtheimia ornata]
MHHDKTALVLGSTGAVGKALVKDLLFNGDYQKVITVGRRPVELDSNIPQDKLEQKTVDFDKLEEHRDKFKNVNDVFCCLGTTRADAGSSEAFKRIDQGYVLNSAKIIAEENKPVSDNTSTSVPSLSPVHFLYCSSAHSNPNSPFLYPQSKGQTEQGIINTGFQRVSIFHPGYLELEEPRPRTRLLETTFGSVISPINRFFNLHLAVPVTRVAEAMRKAAASDVSAGQTSSLGKETIVDRYVNKEIEEMTL